MSTVPCAQCDKPVGDALVCSGCAWRLEKALGEVTWIVEQLDIVLTRQTATAPSWEPRGSKASEPLLDPEPGDRPGASQVGLPFNPAATEARWVLENTVGTWARVVEEESPGARFPTVPLGGHLGIVATWLSVYAEWLRHHAAADEAFDELLGAINQARQLIDVRPERWYAGPCGGTEDKPCGHDLYARPGKPEIRCPSCGARYDATARREWLIEAANDHLATAAECSALCRPLLGDLVSTAMIRGYVHRGKLAAHGSGLDRRGRTVAMFRVGDVIAAATVAKFDAREQRAAKKAARSA